MDYSVPTEVQRPVPLNADPQLTETYPLIQSFSKRRNELQIQEISVKSLILVIFLSILLGSANAYLGLFAGITISVSIPSAILAMAFLKPFNASTLEINAVQTGSAAGSSLAGGVIYTLPALILLGYWDHIHYLETTLIALVGGILGVMFSVPLRRVLIVENPLVFPEGVATAEVIKVAHVAKNRKSKVLLLVGGGLVGVLSKLCQTGFLLWSGSFQAAWFMKRAVIYIGCSLSPALVSVGYIVKFKISFLMFLGGILNWWLAIPIMSSIDDKHHGKIAMYIANALWNEDTRYIGVGAMLMGSLGVVISLGRPLQRGLRRSLEAYRIMKQHGLNAISRTERDIPVPFIFISVIILTFPMAIIYYIVTHNVLISITMTFFMMIAGFLFAAVGAYLAGIVGSSNNPISGVTLGTVIVASALLLLFLGAHNKDGPPLAILIGAVVCCATAISGDNMQDLKAGFIVGSTPMVLQIMQLVGVVIPSLVLAPIIQMLVQAYGIGAPDSLHPTPLPAPQASLMRAVTYSIFFGDIPYMMVVIGASFSFLVMLIDLIASRTKYELRIPVLSIALGLYLPLDLTTPIFLGGLVAWLSTKTLEKAQCSDRQCKINQNNGLLYAAGIISGEALLGILLAIPIVITGKDDMMAFLGRLSIAWPGCIVLFLILVSIYAIVVRGKILEISWNGDHRNHSV